MDPATGDAAASVGQVAEFDRDYFDRLRAAQSHWWVVGMLDIAFALVGRSAGSLRVLDAGCGSGALLEWEADLARPGRVSAIDFAPSAVVHARRVPVPVDVALASVTHIPFRDDTFDLVVSMDVLQHLTSEQAEVAAREMARVLVPGGRVLVRTNSRFGRGSVRTRDDWRLYDRALLRRTLEDAGFEVERLTPVNALQGLWASVPRSRRLAREPHGHEHDHAGQRPPRGLGIPAPVGRLRNQVLRGVLRAEAAWLARAGRSLPFGHSLYAVGRRRR